MMKIALVTYDDQGKYTSSVENEDAMLLQFLQAKGLNIRFEIWSDPAVNWEQYGVAILKSPWDYFDRIDHFYQWLHTLKQKQVRLLNPAAIVKWNSDKHYLADIAKANLPVIPSFFLEKGQNADLMPFFEQLQTDKLIVKPCISGGAKNTYAISREDLPQITPVLQTLLQEEAFLVQPFIPQIQATGEWSFIFFKGKFSHSLLKKAKPGDFRVQHYLGGTIHPEVPPTDLLRAATAYVDQFASNCLYARVDGLAVNQEFLLMELELIEPFLFLHTDVSSFEKYYAALQTLL